MTSTSNCGRRTPQENAHSPPPAKFDEKPDAGEEWVTKALLLGATLEIYHSVWGVLWMAKLNGRHRLGVTQASACRKLVRAITGRET